MGTTEAVQDGSTPRVRRPALFVGALWIYALTFGFLALVGIRLLELVVSASKLRTAIELAIMVAAALAGTYLAVPVLKITRRFWTRELDWYTSESQESYGPTTRMRNANGR